ncbi:NACHT domain-containing protein [Streptomyces roseoverticillatus]|uniref:serine protease n=1 Tax=Streptomyces roseoverticillatus TaxID=66429 RepID=UPI001F47E94E|nr:serine protease [Streptomyces roseoverticillatus]MCF3103425.1 NACHT domain-containing protein [Streptomyces roseoverticillatus]
MHPAKERIAAVFGRSQGSGYLLAPNLVLTAAHVIGDCAHPRVIVPGGTGQVRCRVVWARDDNRRCDVALLVGERDLVPEDVAEAFEPLVWGRAYDLRVWPGAQAVGFPHVQRDAAGELDTEQVVGSLKPGSNLLSGRHVLDSEHGPPLPPADGGSPWAGMSGAAVFVEGLLAGVVCADPHGWQHGRLTVTPSATLWQDFAFLSACLLEGHKPESRSLASPRQLEIEAFERRLRDYIVEKSGELTIIGLTLSDGEGETWPLDAAYLSLELTGGGAQSSGYAEARVPDEWAAENPTPSPKRAEEALAGRRRVLLRGAAGSGKTTLLQWLATLTARGDLPPGLGHLSGCMPLTLPLRTLIRRGELPQPEEFLAAAAGPLAGLPAAQGWVTRRLTEGTALLLIDGVDEVPEADRRRTLTWVKDLLAAYPDARYVITTRPSAVREGWLADAGFTELELLPMSRGDVVSFIDRWHDAAGARHHEPLRAFRDALTTAVVTKRDLGMLATNPLMCALICALNRSRKGYLPHGRMELYRAALELLLVRRDRERGVVVGADGPELEHAQQVALLQKIAYWLIRNGRSVIEWHKAVEILDRALPAMPAVAARGGAEDILRHLVLRSGLLRRPTTETLDFIHRTFQDYLGAQAAVDDWDFDVLVNHAHDDQWEDVLRMAVGHAPPRARAELLRMLLERGDKEAGHRARLHLLAAACLEHATEVDWEVRARVEKAAGELVPPRDLEAARELATAGKVVLDLLPGPEGLTDEVAHAVVVAATTVADEKAMPLLSRYVDHPHQQVRAQLAWAWDRFPTEPYAEGVIGRLAYEGEAYEALEFVAKTEKHLAALKRLGGRPRVQLRDWPAGGDLSDLATPVLSHVTFWGHGETVDLRVLRGCRPLRGLRVVDFGRLLHLDALDVRALESLHVWLADHFYDFGTMRRMPELRELTLSGRAATASLRSMELSLPPKLRYLNLGSGPCMVTRFWGLAGHPELQELAFRAGGGYRSAFALESLPALRSLRIWGEDLRTLTEAGPVPQVETLNFTEAFGLAGLGDVRRAYPGLKEFQLIDPVVVDGDPLDLAPLANLGPIKLLVRHPGPVINQEALPEGSELTLLTQPT